MDEWWTRDRLGVVQDCEEEMIEHLESFMAEVRGVAFPSGEERERYDAFFHFPPYPWWSQSVPPLG